MSILPEDHTFPDLENKVKKFLRYESILNFFTVGSFFIPFIPLILAIAISNSMNMTLSSLSSVLLTIIGGLFAFASIILPRRKMVEYHVEDDEWVRFYTRLIYINLEKYFKEETSHGMKKGYRKKALKNARAFLSCMEERWKIGSFKPVRLYVGNSVSDLKKNFRYRIIPAIRNDDNGVLEEVEHVIYNFLYISKSLPIKEIDVLNNRMAQLPDREPSERGYLNRLSVFLKSQLNLKDVIATLVIIGICSTLFTVFIYEEISKDNAMLGAIAVFVCLFGVYFGRKIREKT